MRSWSQSQGRKLTVGTALIWRLRSAMLSLLCHQKLAFLSWRWWAKWSETLWMLLIERNSRLVRDCSESGRRCHLRRDRLGRNSTDCKWRSIKRHCGVIEKVVLQNRSDRRGCSTCGSMRPCSPSGHGGAIAKDEWCMLNLLSQ